jgi:hypothetical protein
MEKQIAMFEVEKVKDFKHVLSPSLSKEGQYVDEGYNVTFALLKPRADGRDTMIATGIALALRDYMDGLEIMWPEDTIDFITEIKKTLIE